MTVPGDKVEKQLREITECPICMSAFTDPRMLPCIHTFCLKCLKGIADTAQKKPWDKMPCPLCRKEFKIPVDGMNGVQRNFFMENLLEFKTALQSNDPILKIGSETDEKIKRMTNVKFCTKHTQKTLDYNCADCKKIVCVSCFVESHKLHDCKDVATVDEEFRQMIKKYAWKTTHYADEMLSLRKTVEMRKTDFLQKIVENEMAIMKRSQELKDTIDRHTKSLLHELSAIKSYHLKEIENEMEEIDTSCTILRSFEAYCTELRLKGSASDICSSVDQLINRADELEKEHEAFIGRSRKSVEVSLQVANLREVLQKSTNNFVGQIKAKTETSTKFDNCAILVGLNDGATRNKRVVKINLNRPNNISTRKQIPTTMAVEAVAAVYCNTMYVTGIGDNTSEIWKYNMASGWMKCASLVQGRRRHSAAFIDEVLYICGGFLDSDGSVLDSVEAYNAVTNKCTVVGKLVHCVASSGNCVPFRSSVYIFGGKDKDYKAFNHVQVYNTKENTCSILSKSMPWPYILMRAVLWDTSVILFGRDTCYIFNFETETWQERKQFKTDVVHFGSVLENDRVFVIGGGRDETDKDGKTKWKRRDDVRYVPLRNIIDDKPIEWMILGKLPKPSFVYAYANMRFLV